jgi:hypothetical protein
MSIPKFELYYTLNTNISDKKLTKKEIATLESSIKNLKDKKSSEAIVMLICEHARCIDNFEVITNNQFLLPYEGIQDDNNIKFDVGKLPTQLVRILQKFCDIQNS